MTSIRDHFAETLAVGETFCLAVDTDEDGTLVATHPYASSPVDVAVVEGLEKLDALEEVDRDGDRITRPPTAPIAVEIVGRFVAGGDLIAGRVVGLECDTSEP